MRFLAWPIAVTATGAAVTVLLLALLLATELLPGAPMERNLQRSIAQGSLQPEDWPWDRTRGFNQYNDCLLVMMTRFRQSSVSSTVAPLVVFNDYPVLLVDAQGNRRTECSIAIQAVQSAFPRELLPPDRYFPYSRYVHGYRIPFHVFISAVPLAEIRLLYRTVVVTLLILILAGQVYRSYRAFGSSDRSQGAAALAFAGITTSLLLFSGIDLFSQSLTHGPSDIILIAALGWLSLRPYRPGIKFDVVVAALAGLAFGFDFMHGTVPMMLAIILGSMALQAFAAREQILPIDLVRSCGAFFLGVSGAVAAKLLAVLAVVGWEGVASFFGQLSYRLGGDNYALADVVGALRASTVMIGWGMSFFPKAAVILGLAAAAGAALLVLFGRMAAWRRMAVLTALLSIATILAWYALFRNHTAIHAGFMVRLLAWPIGAGPACLLLAMWPLCERRASHANGDRASGQSAR
jgi:hypothetical protein